MHLTPQNTSSKKVEIYQHISLCFSVDVLGCAAAGICACVCHWLNFGFCCALYPSKGIMQNIILQVTTVKLPLSAIFRLQHSMLMETLFTRFECFLPVYSYYNNNWLLYSRQLFWFNFVFYSVNLGPRSVVWSTTTDSQSTFIMALGLYIAK